MKQLFLVGGNAISVSMPDNLPAWQALESRYSPFLTDEAMKPVLEVVIRTQETLPESEDDQTYTPPYAGIDMVLGRASCKSDGSLVMEFKPVHQCSRRLWMLMSPQRDRAEIVIAPRGDGNDPHFLTHALMIAFMLATTGNGTLVIHSSTVLYDGKAYMFQGKSGTGKSTHASLWTANIEGAELLNDDNPVIRFSADGVAMVYGSPWSGKTHCYRNVSGPIGALVRIVRAPNNELRRLSPLHAYASLTTSVAYLPLLSEEAREIRHKTIERLVGAVECCEMHCRPDADAALTCMSALTK